MYVQQGPPFSTKYTYFLQNKDYTLMHKTSGLHLFVSRVVPSMFLHVNQPMIGRPSTVCKGRCKTV